MTFFRPQKTIMIGRKFAHIPQDDKVKWKIVDLVKKSFEHFLLYINKLKEPTPLWALVLVRVYRLNDLEFTLAIWGCLLRNITNCSIIFLENFLNIFHVLNPFLACLGHRIDPVVLVWTTQNLHYPRMLKLVNV